MVKIINYKAQTDLKSIVSKITCRYKNYNLKCVEITEKEQKIEKTKKEIIDLKLKLENTKNESKLSQNLKS